MSTTAPPTTHSKAEPAERRLQTWLESLHALSESPIDVRRFYSEWLGRLKKAIDAEAARLWIVDPTGQWQVAHGDPAEPAQENALRLRNEALAKVAGAGHAAATPAFAPDGDAQPVGSSVWYPVSAAGVLRGVAELRVRVVTESAQAGIINFIGQAVAFAVHFHLLDDRRQLTDFATTAASERRLLLDAHRHLELTKAAHVVADDGRLFLGCERLTVLVRQGRRQRVVAVSGQESFDKRSAAVRALQKLARRAVVAGTPLRFPEPDATYDEATAGLLERYVDEHDVKRIIVLPLEPDHDETSPAVKRERPVGTLIVEYFGRATVPDDESRRLDVVVRCAKSALRNAVAHESLFLYGLWRFLGGLRSALAEPGTWRRTALVAALLAAAVAALVYVPVDDTAYCRGTLQPAARRNVFAPLDGSVAKILVVHGQRVAKGQPLVELRNTALEIAQADLEGKQRSLSEHLIALERTLLDAAQKLAPQERARLAGEQSQLREQLESLERQAKLYAERREQLLVRSPVDGEITTWNADHLLENRPVREGQVLLTLADVRGGWELELNLPDDLSGRVVTAAAGTTEPLPVTFSPALSPGSTSTARVVEIHNSAEIRGDDGNTVLVRAAVEPSDAAPWRPGAEVAAHIHCGRRSLGYVWGQGVVDFLRSKVLFRWF